ncbi:MAG: hypothetical protein HOJ90_03505 [Alphaproteobacteria bacterium]|jgi:hypothetical protein|nr:hypothetical protein [Alphaproteobacteria bacterium]
MKFVISLLAALTITVVAGVPVSADLSKPAGSVVLTIGGAVSEGNRGPSDKFDDAFLASHEYTFENAAAFDVAMLEKLGMVTTKIKAAPWPRAVMLEGPRLRDVLAVTGWTGSKITTVALDGFAVEISASDIATHDWILALKADGEYLSVGGRGPAWLLYDVDGGKASAEDESQWPWAVFYIQAE